MGGRGGSSGLAVSKEAVENGLIANGGKRWQKNGQDRIYLSKALGYELDLSAPGAPPYASRSVVSIVGDTVRSAYYDANSGRLEYKKSRYDWANNHVEKEYEKLMARIRRKK